MIVLGEMSVPARSDYPAGNDGSASIGGEIDSKHDAAIG